MDDIRREWDETMQAVVSETIESMAFMEVEPGDGSAVFDEHVLTGTLLVHDPVQGEFKLVIPRELIDQIAEIVYGPLMTEITEQNKLDLLAELLNTIAGRFLSEILPGNESFRLGLPELVAGAYIKPDPASLVWNYTMDGIGFLLSVSGESLLGRGL